MLSIKILMEQKNKKNTTPWIWGFNVYAENWNGRLAMISFLLIICVEFITNKNVLDLVKLN